MSFRDQAAIVGVGFSELSWSTDASTLTLACRAIVDALADAGLETFDIDGVATHRRDDSADAAIVAQALGVPDLRSHLDLWGDGSVSLQVLAHAVMTISSGQADCIVCWRSIRASPNAATPRPRSTSLASSRFTSPYTSPYRYGTAEQQLAMYSRVWMHRQGTTVEDLARVVTRQREHATKDERALLRDPLTIDEYLDSPMRIDPLRELDFGLVNDGAVAIVVMATEMARDLARPPVLISGVATGSGHTLLSNGFGDLSVSGAAAMAPRLFAQADVTPDDIDLALLADGCSPLVLMQLEEYDLCDKGDAALFYAAEEMPINTHGGFLAHGCLEGLDHVAEAVLQLRGSCGDRQIDRAQTALVTAMPGFGTGTTSAMILRSDQ